MPNLTGPKEPSGSWEIFLGMWERANLVRSFFWSQRTDDFKVLLSHFLTRLRRYFAVDFCLAVLNVSDESLLEVRVPEFGETQLPDDFSRRCLESLANSRAPITWKEAGSGLGFRSTVVVPLRAPTGASFGFLLLGHARNRPYTAVELFVLQALAGELSWVLRDVAARNKSKQKLQAAAHGMKNAVQAMLNDASMLRQKAAGHECDQHLDGIERAVQQILECMRALPEEPGDHPVTSEISESEKISTIVNQSLVSCQQRARERGIDLEVVCALDSSVQPSVYSERIAKILTVLIDKAALSTRNETVHVTVKPGSTDLQLMVRGTRSNKVADGLKALFEGTARWEDAREEWAEDWERVREYLEDTGGDVYLKSRPGEAAEFVMRLPIEGVMQPAPAVKP